MNRRCAGTIDQIVNYMSVNLPELEIIDALQSLVRNDVTEAIDVLWENKTLTKRR